MMAHVWGGERGRRPLRPRRAISHFQFGVEPGKRATRARAGNRDCFQILWISTELRRNKVDRIDWQCCNPPRQINENNCASSDGAFNHLFVSYTGGPDGASTPLLPVAAISSGRKFLWRYSRSDQHFVAAQWRIISDDRRHLRQQL